MQKTFVIKITLEKKKKYVRPFCSNQSVGESSYEIKANIYVHGSPFILKKFDTVNTDGILFETLMNLLAMGTTDNNLVPADVLFKKIFFAQLERVSSLDELCVNVLNEKIDYPTIAFDFLSLMGMAEDRLTDYTDYSLERLQLITPVNISGPKLVLKNLYDKLESQSDPFMKGVWQSVSEEVQMHRAENGLEDLDVNPIIRARVLRPLLKDILKNNKYVFGADVPQKLRIVINVFPVRDFPAFQFADTGVYRQYRRLLDKRFDLHFNI